VGSAALGRALEQLAYDSEGEVALELRAARRESGESGLDGACLDLSQQRRFPDPRGTLDHE
jgi:hypothetical protein